MSGTDRPERATKQGRPVLTVDVVDKLQAIPELQVLVDDRDPNDHPEVLHKKWHFGGLTSRSFGEMRAEVARMRDEWMETYWREVADGMADEPGRVLHEALDEFGHLRQEGLFASNVGYLLDDEPVPPSTDDLAEWESVRWWWELQNPNRLDHYDNKAQKATHIART
jgi:hypothetical protein